MLVLRQDEAVVALAHVRPRPVLTQPERLAQISVLQALIDVWGGYGIVTKLLWNHSFNITYNLALPLRIHENRRSIYD